jgi:hypothetical protein
VTRKVIPLLIGTYFTEVLAAYLFHSMSYAVILRYTDIRGYNANARFLIYNIDIKSQRIHNILSRLKQYF